MPMDEIDVWMGLNLNNRLFRGGFCDSSVVGPPLFSFITKNICKLFVSKTRIVENISAALLFIFKKGDLKRSMIFIVLS